MRNGTDLRKTEPRCPQYREETKDESWEGQVQVRRRRTDRAEGEQERHAKECDECACDPEALHAAIVADHKAEGPAQAGGLLQP